MVALFFFFRDGSRLAIKVTELLPLEREHQVNIAGTFSKTVTAVVRAIFLTALFQGFMTGLGLAIVARRASEAGGKIELESPAANGRGARFSVWLPLEKQERAK